MPGVKLSPKHGLNPTIPVCFWCGEDREEIVLLGRIDKSDKEAPMRSVIDFEPCNKCHQKMRSGFTIIEATREPNSRVSVEMQTGVYPTGRYAVLKKDAAERLFSPEYIAKGVGFMTDVFFDKLICGADS